MRTTFQALSCSSQTYFTFLLDLQLRPELLWPQLSTSNVGPSDIEALVEGYVTTADSGSEDLLRSARAALVEFCDESGSDVVGVSGRPSSNLTLVCGALVDVLNNAVAGANERVVVSALEVIAFLFDAEIMQRSDLS